jgi:hypothetical protein
MPLVLNFDVRWRDSRLVHVICRSIPTVADSYRSGGPEKQPSETPLFDANTTSRDSFLEYLSEITIVAPNGSEVRIAGYETQVWQIVKVLEIKGSIPDPIVISLER